MVRFALHARFKGRHNVSSRSRRTVVAGIALVVLTIMIGNLAAIAINAAASAQARWPGGLELIRRDPFWWAGLLTVLAILAGSLLWCWENRSIPPAHVVSADEDSHPVDTDPAAQLSQIATHLDAAQFGLS